ncbi:hypothetical protein J6590_007053 [Homalodisca vitripennis]|nr:hypothetical protein J6590_007053 [Homalodisca vitripennis]
MISGKGRRTRPSPNPMFVWRYANRACSHDDQPLFKNSENRTDGILMGSEGDGDKDDTVTGLGLMTSSWGHLGSFGFFHDQTATSSRKLFPFT